MQMIEQLQFCQTAFLYLILIWPLHDSPISIKQITDITLQKLASSVEKQKETEIYSPYADTHLHSFLVSRQLRQKMTQNVNQHA